MTDALARIAELHQPDDAPGIAHPACRECRKPWPCPTRRLCDEADETNLTEGEAERMWEQGEPVDVSVDPDLKLTIVGGPELQSAMASVGYPDPRPFIADAERLAALLRARGWEFDASGFPYMPDEVAAALAAHDALTAE
jgi:hypothetical protein